MVFKQEDFTEQAQDERVESRGAQLGQAVAWHQGPKQRVPL